MNGWKVDHDDWVVRAERPGDAAYVKPHSAHAFVVAGKVYCRSNGQARAIDKRKKTTPKAFARRVNSGFASVRGLS